MKMKKMLSLMAAAAIAGSCVAGMATSASAAEFPAEMNDLATISQDTIIDVSKIIDTAKLDAKSNFTGYSKDNLVYCNGIGYKTNSITVDGVAYPAALNLKAIDSRAFAIKVQAPCTVTSYGNTNSTRYVAMSTTADGTNVVSNWSKADNGNGVATANITGTDATTLYFYSGQGSDIRVNMIDVKMKEDTGETVNVEGIELDPTTAVAYVGETTRIAAKITPADATDPTVTWTSSDDTIATVAGGTVTGVAPGTATITATTNDGGYTATAEVEVKEIPRVSGVDGTVADLTAAAATTTYDFLATAKAINPLDAEAVYNPGQLYFNNQVYVVGEAGYDGLLYYSAKTSANFGDTMNDDGIRLKAGQDVFAVKLAAGATVEVPVYGGGGGDRYGIIAENYDANSTAGALASTLNIGTAAGSNPQTLTYTNDTGADKVVYITATGDSFFSQVRVTVPEVVEPDPVEKTLPEVTVTAGKLYNEEGSLPAKVFTGKFTVGENNYSVKAVDWTVTAADGKSGTKTSKFNDTIITGTEVVTGLVVEYADAANLTKANVTAVTVAADAPAAE